MADDIQEEVRSRTLQLLLDKVHADTYPSSTMLDIVERLLSPQDVGDYAEVLWAKIEGENYPSYAPGRTADRSHLTGSGSPTPAPPDGSHRGEPLGAPAPSLKDVMGDRFTDHGQRELVPGTLPASVRSRASLPAGEQAGVGSRSLVASGSRSACRRPPGTWRRDDEPPEATIVVTR